MFTRRDTLQLGIAGLALPSIGSAAASGTPVAQQPRSSVPMYRGNAARTGEMPGPAPSLEEPIIVKWRFLPEGGAAAPTVAAGKVYTVERSGLIAVLDFSTGEPLQQITLSSAPGSAPTVHGNVMYVGTADGYAVAIDASTGSELWRSPVTSESIVFAPLVADGVAYVASAGILAALDIATGDEIWNLTEPNQFFFLPVLDSGVLVSSTFALFAADSSTGELLWEHNEAAGIPAMADGVVYAGSYGGGLYAIDAFTGEDIWTIETGSWSDMPSIANGRVYVGSEESSLLAVDAATGEQIWELTSDAQSWGGPVIADGQLFVANSYRADKGYADLLCIDAITGEQYWSLPLEQGYISDPVIVDGTILVSYGGELLALGNVTDDMPPDGDYEYVYRPK